MEGQAYGPVCVFMGLSDMQEMFSKKIKAVEFRRHCDTESWSYAVSDLLFSKANEIS